MQGVEGHQTRDRKRSARFFDIRMVHQDHEEKIQGFFDLLSIVIKPETGEKPMVLRLVEQQNLSEQEMRPEKTAGLRPAPSCPGEADGV